MHKQQLKGIAIASAIIGVGLASLIGVGVASGLGNESPETDKSITHGVQAMLVEDFASLEEVQERSDLVIRATPVSSKVVLVEDLPFTKTRVDVSEVLTGGNHEVVTVSQVGDQSLRVQNLPAILAAGSEYILYLNELTPGQVDTEYNVIASYRLNDENRLALDIEENPYAIPGMTSLIDVHSVAARNG